MDDIGDSLWKEIFQANVTMFKSAGIEPGALDNGLVPVDIDVSPFDNSKTKKEGVSQTYKGMDGYTPVFAFICTEGYLVNCELREGKQHCQKGTPEFLRQTLKPCHQLTDKSLLVRLDSENDAAKNLGILLEDGSWFIIKRNPRNSETKKGWLNNVKDWCKDICHSTCYCNLGCLKIYIETFHPTLAKRLSAKNFIHKAGNLLRFPAQI